MVILVQEVVLELGEAGAANVWSESLVCGDGTGPDQDRGRIQQTRRREARNGGRAHTLRRPGPRGQPLALDVRERTPSGLRSSFRTLSPILRLRHRHFVLRSEGTDEEPAAFFEELANSARVQSNSRCLNRLLTGGFSPTFGASAAGSGPESEAVVAGTLAGAGGGTLRGGCSG